MPEITGIIKAKSQYGVKMTDDGDWWNWSKPEYRGEPFDTSVVAGDTVHVEYAAADSGKVYISTIGKVTAGSASPTPVGPTFTENDHPQTWGYEQKDRLMCRESCIKSATNVFAASIQAGIYKTHPDVSAVTAYASSLERWCLAAVDSVDEIPFE